MAVTVAAVDAIAKASAAAAIGNLLHSSGSGTDNACKWHPTSSRPDANHRGRNHEAGGLETPTSTRRGQADGDRADAGGSQTAQAADALSTFLTQPSAGASASRMATNLTAIGAGASAADGLQHLVRAGVDRLPMPGGGGTAERWRALAAVAAHDLSLAKLYEGHTDALAIIEELHPAQVLEDAGADSTWGVWAAEAPAGRAVISRQPDGELLLGGAKCWCSGADTVSHAILTAWYADGDSPQLVAIDMRRPGIEVDRSAWQAVGMAQSSSLDLRFDAVPVKAVGAVGSYTARPGFWHGGAGIAACWYGGAMALAGALHAKLRQAAGQSSAPQAFALAGLGRVDVAMRAAAAVLRETAAWIDAHPQQDAHAVALRARLAVEAAADEVLQVVGRTLGAAPFCRDARFARIAADLPVYLRQSHAERDLAALGQTVATGAESPWMI